MAVIRDMRFPTLDLKHPFREAHVLAALRLLRSRAPQAYARILREVDTIVFDPTQCGVGSNAIACAWPHARVVVLRWDPLRMDVVTVAGNLFHEALHIETGADGRPRSIPHHCRDCSDPYEQWSDPIYIEEAILVARLRQLTGIAETAGSPPAEATVPSARPNHAVPAALALGGAGFVVGGPVGGLIGAGLGLIFGS